MDNVQNSTEIIHSEHNLYNCFHQDIPDQPTVIDDIKIYESPTKPIEKCDHDVVCIEEAEGKIYNPNAFVTIETNMENAIPSRFIPYTSYLSQINSKPVDIQIASVKQEKKEVTPINVSNADSDDEVYMWVEKPTVIILDSSDEDGNSNGYDTKVELKNNSNDRQGDNKRCHDSHENPIECFEPKLKKTKPSEMSSSVGNGSKDNFATHKRTKRKTSSRKSRGVCDAVLGSADVPNSPGHPITDERQKVIPSDCFRIEEEERYWRSENSKLLECCRISNSDYTIEKTHTDRKTFENSGQSESYHKYDEGTSRRHSHQRNRPHHRSNSKDFDDREHYDNAKYDASTQRCNPSRFSVDLESPTDYCNNQKTSEGCESYDFDGKISEVSEIVSIDPVDDDDETQTHHHQVKKRGESESFSFINEMDKLSLWKFDLSFLTTPPVDNCPPNDQQIDYFTSINETKHKSPKALAEMEVSILGDMRIVIAKTYAQLLLSRKSGYNFLNDAFTKHKVKVRMQWECEKNVLEVVGKKVNQNRFYDDLVELLEKIIAKRQMRNEKANPQ